jgi:hypothetical protein
MVTKFKVNFVNKNLTIQRIENFKSSDSEKSWNNGIVEQGNFRIVELNVIAHLYTNLIIKRLIYEQGLTIFDL